MAAGSHDSAVQEAGLGLMAAGLIGKIVSGLATPAADTRTWENLPNHLTFAAVELAPGQHTASIEFLDAGGRPLAGLTRNVTIIYRSRP